MVALNGTIRADTLTGTLNDDSAVGGPGSDAVFGRQGNDTLSGGDGNDSIYGGQGDDVIYGHGPADLVQSSGDITATRIAAGLDTPVFATSAPGDPDRLYVIEKTGQVQILNTLTGALNPVPFLDIPPRQLQTTTEKGLLSIAFHPDYAANGKFYVFICNAAGDLEVREYTRSAGNPDIAAPASANTILIIPHPTNDNHNGSWMDFGPDGMLYIAVGDGGAVGDPANSAQNPNDLLGKILRIDVNGDDFAGDPARDYAIPDDNPFVAASAADEIWALGLRNPWRGSFDALTGDLYIGDVGQQTREEINFQAAGSPGGQNYGWVIREGTLVYDPTRPGNLPPDSPLLIDPIFDFSHGTGEDSGFSVIGGYVYRGPDPGMQGVYLYADFITGQLWSFRVVDGAVTDYANRTEQLVVAGGQIDLISSFAEDGRGNLYIIGIDGEIYRLQMGEAAGDGDDSLRGGEGNDLIHGRVGDDTLRGDEGNDSLKGGGGDDLIAGGAGTDWMAGGSGADVFDFNAVSDSGNDRMARDAIRDFETGVDKIDLLSIDAQQSGPGNEAFTFIGTAAFSAEGQIRVVQSANGTIVLVNTAGTDAAEMQIFLKGVQATDLTLGDFVL